MSSYVYVWTNEINGNRYVGKGKGYRASDHLGNAERGSKDCPAFYGAVRKYGPEAFALGYIATGLDDATALRVEAAFISMYGTRAEYNLSDGGDGPSGAVRSPETRAKLSAANKGKKPTPETVAKGAATRTGMKRSDDAKANMSKAQKGRVVSEAAKAKKRETERRKFAPQRQASVALVVEHGATYAAAAEAVGVSAMAVWKWVKAHRGTAGTDVG